jgi:hypothetical protein
MAYTAGFSVSVGDPTKASDVTTLAANDDYLKAAVDGKAALSGSTNNTVATVTGANALIGEADLTFAANKLTVFGTTGTGAATASVLNLSTRETTVVDADQLGRIEFQAPAETGSDAVLVAASIYAEADGTFSATVNATDLVLATAHDGAAAERVRITSQGEIGLAGANYGTDGQVITSAGAGAAAAWETIPPGTTLSGSTNNTIATVTGANALIGEANLTFDGTDLAIGNTAPSSYMNSVHGLIVGDTSDATSEITIATGTSGTGELNFTDTADTTNQAWVNYDHSAGVLDLGSNGGSHLALCPSGLTTIVDTSNAFMTTGLTINQLGADNEILAFKSSDVGHPFTSLAEADTYSTFTKYDGSLGGCIWRGFNESGMSQNMAIRSYGVNVDTSDTSGSVGPISFSCNKSNGSTGSAAMADADNMVLMDNAGTARFILKGNGTLHITNTTLAALDDEDDIGLVRAFQKASSKGVGLVMSKWDEVMKENEEDLRRVGVLSSESDFVIQQNFNSLIGGSVWQLYTKLQDTKEFYQDKIAALEARLMRLEN